MTRPNTAWNGFVTVFAVAAIALLFAGTMVASSDKSDPAREPHPVTTPDGQHSILWDIG